MSLNGRGMLFFFPSGWNSDVMDGTLVAILNHERTLRREAKYSKAKIITILGHHIVIEPSLNCLQQRNLNICLTEATVILGFLFFQPDFILNNIASRARRI